MSDETVNNLRHRLLVMKEILNEEEDPSDEKARKKIERRKKKNCLDTIIDGSFMGLILVKLTPKQFILMKQIKKTNHKPFQALNTFIQ